ncbi:hypothetical protein HPB47_019026 [Ixodes persulcatus]|uniref:Uncharacterized protein n=1 Tax=Ixodes persulcatus TaxID=34615 RepID=A0AC60QZR0_IXOPE|nr:hypothetical protein HPB47_019026 [Ixodes persulcatus]
MKETEKEDRRFILPLKTQLILVLMRLRLGLDGMDLAFRTLPSTWYSLSITSVAIGTVLFILTVAYVATRGGINTEEIVKRFFNRNRIDTSNETAPLFTISLFLP